MSVIASGVIAPFLLLLPLATVSAKTFPSPFATTLEPLFQKHCIQCHGQDGVVKGKVDLLTIKSEEDFLRDPDLAAVVLDVIEFEEMPPKDEPQPTADDRTKFIAALKTILHSSVAENKAFAQAPIRRLNRFQYNNAVTDLFQLNRVVFPLPERMMREYKDYFQPASGKMPEQVTVGSRPLGKSQMIEPRLAGVSAFPQDLRAEHGYDNRGDHLSLSPFLLEAFLKLSKSIVDSPDFTPANVAIWKEFFAPPVDGTPLKPEIKKRLRAFLTHAFRRPVDDTLQSRYTDHVLAQINHGTRFTDAMKSAAAAAIASPRFLYLYDQPGAGSLDEYDLASRLSFFLWGSIPDDELLRLAKNNRLTNPEILAKQIDRMLDDRRLKRFCDSFPAQWLQLDRIISAAPDIERFPEFYSRARAQYRLSMDQSLEPLLLFETVLVEDRPILDLIDPDFTYRSPLLHQAYGHTIDSNKFPVTALPFNRQEITDRREGGVITNQAVMTMTSGAERTHPITRGAWLATVIFNNPPPPPPADIPPLSEKPPEGEEHLTLRERLDVHRERADCAGCHQKIDPLGFALENYGPTGLWRDQYENGRDVDMQGVLFRKHEFNNLIEFKDAILTEKDRFTRALAGHLLSFALARELNAADAPALDNITANTAENEYRIQTLLKEVILSEPFLSKSNPATLADN
ncbi:MAG: DUF1592 domain-containing protein [Verrucomicrobiota bacterium]